MPIIKRKYKQAIDGGMKIFFFIGYLFLEFVQSWV